MPIQSKNPATGKIIKTFRELSEKEVKAKIVKAERAFQTWKDTAWPERKRLMLNLAKYLRAHTRELSLLQTLEMGKTISSGPTGIEKCARLCEYYAENAEKILQPEKIKTKAKENKQIYVRFDPLGIILEVMPWNFPFWQVYRFAVPAIMAGNVGLLKHASNVPQCAEAIEKSFRQTGFPEGVFQNLRIGAGVVESVIRDPRVAAVSLTGSEQAGSEVARIAGSEIKKSVMELGGSDSFIVFADVDIKEVARQAISARLQANVGQSCISAKRFIVHRSIIKKFIAELVEQASKLIIGDPADEKTDLGPLATSQILQGVEKQVKQSVALGAKIEYGGKRLEGPGYFYLPTIITGVRPGMPAYDEEVFGPVLAIIPFESEEEAVRVANDTRYGLGASIWTRNKKRAERLIPKIEAGNVFANSIVKSDPRAPFGGIKKSGFGRELGIYGLKEFVNIKHVSIG